MFLMKSDREDDRTLSTDGIYRHPGDLRLLTLKNSDNKSVAGICNWMIWPVVEASACSLQNGFTKGRVFSTMLLTLTMLEDVMP